MPTNRIIIDVMGGDNAPHEIIQGALLALKENSKIKCIFVGDEVQILDILKTERVNNDRYEIVHTPEYITMDDDPKRLLSRNRRHL